MVSKLIRLCAFVSLFVVCVYARAVAMEAAQEASIDAQYFEDLSQALDDMNFHAVLVMRGDEVLYEKYFSRPDENWGEGLGLVAHSAETLHDLRSGTKSIVSALIGIAIDKGFLPGLDVPIRDVLDKAYFANTPQTSEMQSLTLKHVLTMSAGFTWDETTPYTDSANPEIWMWESDTPVRFALSRPFETPPGDRYNYNGGLTQILIAILEDSTGMPAKDFAKQYLFDPLEIKKFHWVTHRSGQVWGASGLRLTAQDFAKLGRLYLQRGEWNGQQVLPVTWVEATFTPHVQTPLPVKYAYGLHWFLPGYVQDGRPLKAALASGNGGQSLFLMPEHDLTVVTFAGYYNQFPATIVMPQRLMQNYILPAIGLTNVKLGLRKAPI